jgi:hypothetical protein
MSVRFGPMADIMMRTFAGGDLIVIFRTRGADPGFCGLRSDEDLIAGSAKMSSLGEPQGIPAGCRLVPLFVLRCSR